MKTSPSTSFSLVVKPADICRHLKLKTAVAIVVGIFSSVSPLAQAASPFAGNVEFAKGRILVEPRAGLSEDELAKILSVHGGKARKIGQSNLHIVDLPGNASETGVIAQLANNPHLKFAELDRRRKSSFVPSDPYFGSEWHLAKVGAPTAWDSTQGSGITIAILDSGIDTTHPDLTPNMVAGYNLVSNNADVTDVCGHGTAVAGTAAASSNNGIGVAGVAGQAKIMALRIASNDPTYGCSSYDSTISSALTYAADHGVKLANVSYGGIAGSASVQSAAQYMKNKGGLVFVSAGNDGVNGNMAATTTMIPVSATDGNDALAGWSSFGNYVALSAPGVGIWTTSQGSGYGSWNGTSFASPLAAGVAALAMAANPSLDNLTIEKLLYSTSVDLGAAGRDIYFGYGRVNAAAAVQAARSTVTVADTTPPTSSITAPQASSSVSGIITVTVAATDNIAVDHVQLVVNGAVVAIASAGPFSFSWDSRNVANGMASLVAVAYDAAGNSSASSAVSVNVANAVTLLAVDKTPPAVTIANPISGNVAGTVAVTVQATDNNGASGISQTLYIDGVLKAKGTGGSLSYSWNTRKVASGMHTIQAIAKDAAGNSTTVTTQVSR